MVRFSAKSRHLCALIVAVATSATAQSPARSAAVRDSAGIHVIDNPRPAWPSGKAWTLSTTPALSIGPGGAPYAFARIAGATRLADGRIVVAERAAHELRFFDATGRHLTTVGRKGQGPGEFTDIGTVMRLPGDSLAVESLRYTSIFAPDGRFVRQVRYGPFDPEIVEVPFVAVIGRFPDGTAIVGDFPQGRHGPRGAARWIDSSSLLLVQANGAVNRFLERVPAIAFGAAVNAPTPLTFGPEMVHASAAGHLYLGFSDQYTLRQYDASWTLKRIIRRAWTPRPLSQVDLDSYVNSWMSMWSKETGVRRERDRLAQLNAPYPDALPAFADLLASPSGVLWLREPDLTRAATCACLSAEPLTPSTWSVFDADGVWLGQSNMPARFTPTEVGEDYVLGYARDANEALRVVMYRIVKSK